MQTTETILLMRDRANVVELAALLEDKSLRSAERRILRQALKQTLRSTTYLAPQTTAPPIRTSRATLN